MYDIIGDIHGHAEPLVKLLQKMGYREDSEGWFHPERKVVFLGDFIDRGPDQAAVIKIAQSMVEAGNARAIMGNHEFNAVSFATPDPDNPGHGLRSDTKRKRAQHQVFLDQMVEGSTAHREAVEWFKTLPIYLDLPGFRAIHACWSDIQIRALQPYLDQHNRLRRSAWAPANQKGSVAHAAIEDLLKGYEITVPGGYIFRQNETPRYEARVRWWAEQDLPLNNSALVPGGHTVEFPDLVVEAAGLPNYDNQKPLFIGHYWFTGTPEPITPHIACLDYSIAARDHSGKLVAYRWDGEITLHKDKFVAVGH